MQPLCEPETQLSPAPADAVPVAETASAMAAATGAAMETNFRAFTVNPSILTRTDESSMYISRIVR
jgi:hypothetical protein